MSPPEHAVLIASVREAAKLIQPEPSSFVEIGVFKGGTSRMIVEVLSDEKKRAVVLGIDPDIKALKRWRYKLFHNAKLSKPYRGEIKREFFHGGLKKAMQLGVVHPDSHCWVFVDGCHCESCAKSDIELSMMLVCPQGLLVLHDTDPRHEDGPADQKYHGDARKFGVHRAIEALEIESHGWLKEKELPGVLGGLRGIRGGLQIYRKL
jgi:hypothetical protein